MSLLDGLISYWKLDGNSNDSVGTNHGTDTNISYTAGKIGDCASFNGTSSKINLTPNSITLPLNTERSFSFWLYGINTGHGFGGLLNNSTGANSYGFNVYTDATLHSVYWAGGSIGSQIQFNVFNAWSHFVFTFDTLGVVRGYLNGVLVTDTGRHNLASFTMDTFGYYYWYNVFLDTKIEEFGIWSKTLSQSEITKLYNNGNGLTYPFVPTNTSNFFQFFK